ncbi:hypothetical protein BDU57DRAFT_29917 [Ampelomyces quisqualis]|uniref:Uncharacterized protein n=1 Tax=Ampelomyces quisqualis TaxID=50730 RepID=A0A6A5QZT9_AMPQU|nr:hypothetical protein BDU57DRAFT_29917 [Ampelomyces quisqualis]
MDTGKNPARHTNIIDDLDAIALAQQGRRKAGSAKKKKKVGTAGTTAASNLRPPTPNKPAEAQRAGPSPSQNALGSRSTSLKKSTVSAGGGSRVYEKDGIRVPRYETGGKQRPHARLSISLRNKSTDLLLDIVEDYAGVAGRKAFVDANTTKAEIAEWIEAQEMRALGSHPKSNLTLSDESLKVHDRAVDFDEPVGQPANYKGNRKAPMHPRDREQGKRKLDSAFEPTQSSQQTTKRHKNRHMDTQLAKQSLARYPKPKANTEDENHHASRKSRKAARRKLNEVMPTLHEDAPEESTKQATEKIMQLPKDIRVTNFMSNVGMHPDNPDTSTMVVRQPEQSEDRILTASTNTMTGKPILHDVSIARNPSQRQLLPKKSVEPPFLKKGIHGRHGGFTNDPDRRPGRGHHVTTEDQKGLDEYLDFRSQVLQAYPRFPGVDAGEEMHPEVKEGWDDNERWYNSFTHKYPGNSVSHLWPCGCEKMRGNSESSDSEEE